MPKLLAIDSSTSTTRVALCNGDQTNEYSTEEPRQAAQQLLPLIEQALQEADLKLAELDAIIVATGPGSFTGLRIGIGAAQGLSAANATPLIGVSSLALLAQAATRHSEATAFIVCLTARDDEVYFGAYCKSEQSVVLQESEAVVVLDESDLSLDLPADAKWVGVGDGWRQRSSLESRFGIKLGDCFAEMQASMQDLLDCGLVKLAREETLSAEDLLPNYVKEQLEYRS